MTETLEFPTEYQPDTERGTHEYNLPAADKKGHSDQIKFHTPQGEVAPRVHALVNSGQLGYRSDGDFYRRAVARMLEVDEAEAGIVTSVGRQLQLLNEVNQLAERNQATKDSIATLANHIDVCVQAGELEEAGELMGMALDVIIRANEGPWKRKTLAEFGEKFSGLRERLGGVGESCND
ncbi:MAG: hypothetical protein Q8P59_05275 [Dehalococcoidia bacterium]|nr:hypothetical protein [Dehalococcoidia bacterium]